MCRLRDLLGELLDVQACRGDDTAIGRLQAELNDVYDRYQARYGPLNRFTWGRTGRIDPGSGHEIMRRNRPRMGGFRDDPDAPSVFALEDFDPATQTATKTAVFTRRLLAPRTIVTSTDDPGDAVLVCLDQVGRVDLDMIATLLDIDAADGPRPARHPGVRRPDRTGPARARSGVPVGQRARQAHRRDRRGGGRGPLRPERGGAQRGAARRPGTR